MKRAETKGERPPPTVSHILGELTWLLTQSKRHQSLPIAEITWLLMPPISHGQFHMFYDGEKPVGAAIWAMLDEASERKFEAGEFMPPHAGVDDWKSGSRRWLIDLIAPFATAENKQAEVIFADLVTGVFKGKDFKMLKIDPDTNTPQIVAIDSDFGMRLAQRAAANLDFAK